MNDQPQFVLSSIWVFYTAATHLQRGHAKHAEQDGLYIASSYIMMFTSTVSWQIKRTMRTGRVWPKRCTRASACCSTATFSEGSRRNT